MGIFLLGLFVLTLHYCKAGQRSHPRWAFATPLCCCLICACCTLHCGISHNAEQQQVNSVQRLDEMPYRHFGTSTHFLDVGRRTQILKCRKSWENDCKTRAIMPCRTAMHLQDHAVHFDKWSFGTSCQAAHIKAFCSGCWVACVFTATAPGFEGNQVETTSLGCFVPIRDYCIHIIPNESSWRGNTPLFRSDTSNRSSYENTPTVLCG